MDRLGLPTMTASERVKQWRLRNPERARASRRASRQKHLGAAIEKRKRLYWSDPEKFRAKAAGWMVANPDKIQAYRERNRERIRSKRRAYYLANKERAKSTARKWRLANIERSIESVRRWQEANPERVLANNAIRRARRRNCSVDKRGLANFIKTVRGKRIVACFHCGEKISGRDAHIDHVIPLAKGGPECLSNRCVSCQPCNQFKHANTLSDWNAKKPGQLVLL